MISAAFYLCPSGVMAAAPVLGTGPSGWEFESPLGYVVVVARVMKPAAMPDLKSGAFGRAGSSPALGTTLLEKVNAGVA